MATFADDALVNDAHREFWGAEAIRRWVAREMVGDRVSIEVTEVRFPLFLRRHEFRPDSGGDGAFRGGAGSVLEMRMDTTEPAVANTAGDGTRHAPYGLFGGRDGRPHRYRLVSRKRVRVLKTKEVGIPVRPGDVFMIESSGGGGYGDPSKRAASARTRDAADGIAAAP